MKSSVSAKCCISYRNQSFGLQCKSNDCFLYEMQLLAETGKSAEFCAGHSQS